MMKHPSRKNDELQKSRDQVRCLCRKFKEQEKDEPQDKLSFDKLVRNDEHLIQDVPWELGGIPNIQDDDMGLDSGWGDDLHDGKGAGPFVVKLLHGAIRGVILEA